MNYAAWHKSRSGSQTACSSIWCDSVRRRPASKPAVKDSWPSGSMPTMRRHWKAFCRSIRPPVFAITRQKLRAITSGRTCHCSLAASLHSLDAIEHQVLRKMGEPRIHFAIVCASIGCPRLLNEAYVPDRLEEQLAMNTRDFFSRPQNFQLDKSGNHACQFHSGLVRRRLRATVSRHSSQRCNSIFLRTLNELLSVPMPEWCFRTTTGRSMHSRRLDFRKSRKGRLVESDDPCSERMVLG